MRLKILLGVLSVGILVGGAVSAYFSTPGDIVLNNQVIMRVRSEAGGFSMEERVGIVYERIAEALAQENKAVKIVAIAGITTIQIGDVMLVTVDEETARVNQCKPIELAGVWVENIEKALADP